MSKESEKDRLRSWRRRIEEADRAYRQWSDKYNCDKLEEYYCGHQLELEQGEEGKGYVVNKILPSVEVRIPSLLFYRPQVVVTPRPSRKDDTGTQVEERAKLQQDTLNTFISDPKLGFREETTLALRESFYRFGVIEVGYTADFIDNPLLHKPELLTEEDKLLLDAKKILNPKNPQPEKLYVKRIPAKSFRVSVYAKNTLSRNDWCGYYEWQRIEDVRANDKYSNTSKLKASGKMAPSVAGTTVEENEKDVDGNDVHRDMLKVWKIWDLRGMKRYVFADAGTERFFIEGEPFQCLPFAAYKQLEKLDSWYPVPPLFNWIPMQDQINEIQEAKHVHRKRYYRRYTYLTGSIEEEEMTKLESGGDGVYAKANQKDPIQAVPDAPLDMQNDRDYAEINNDFREVTGVGDEQRGEVDPSSTATQAQIVEVRSRIRESYQRQNVAEWLSRIATIMLEEIIENMALGFWIKMNCDPFSPAFPMEALKVAEQWKWIHAQDLGELSYDINVDITTMTPVSEEAERNAWTQVLAMMTNPPLLAVLMSSEVLLRKTLSYYNIKSEREIREIQKAGQAMLVMIAQMAQQKAGGSAGAGPQGAEPGPTPDIQAIMSQLQSQMGQTRGMPQ